jgi:DNA-binding transcriptional ArsR family regulator
MVYTRHVTMSGHPVDPGSAAAPARLDRVFHALSDRTRRALLARLSRGPATVTELARPFTMSLPAVSKHLRVLESARLVLREVEGRVHRCSLAPRPLKDVEHWLAHYRTFWEDTLESLGRFVDEDRAARARRPRRGR